MPLNPIAYFSLEFGIDDSLPIFAGGLGILAGDMLFEANRQGKPFVGVGLLYHQAGPVKLEPVIDRLGKPIIIPVSLGVRTIRVKAWKKLVGRVPLYLLDTRTEGNSIADGNIANRLYTGGQDHRLKQNLVAGIGGVKLLRALNITPRYFHLNEAHCAFAIIQLLVQIKQNQPQLSFRQAWQRTKAQTLFTNHTVITDTHNAVDRASAAVYLKPFARKLKTTVNQLLQLDGRQNPGVFSLNYLALNGSIRVNAVSPLHSRIAATVWPGFKFIPVTNGVFLPRWLGKPMAKAWPLTQPLPGSKEKFWQAHLLQKQALLQLVKQRTGIQMEEKILTVTWARRLTEYKRPEAVLTDFDRLEAILNHRGRPVQLLMAGRVHPDDQKGKQLVAFISQLCRRTGFRQRFQFIPHYNLAAAQALTGGSDIWLNTPKRGFEACGTSGMKACLNGVLQMTTKDGWTDNVEWSRLGWTLDSDRVPEDIYRFLEGPATEMYYHNNSRGFPADWLDRMISSSALIRKNYSAARMLDRYEKKLYL